jgi:hypothetical protein
MGAKTWMLVYSDGNAKDILKSHPTLDRGATLALARKLFPGETLEPLADGSLDRTNPPDDELVIGCFPGVSVVAAGEIAIDHPSRLPAPFLDLSLGRTVHLHAMHSVVDWFACAIWEGGKLVRALSLSPDSGILEDIGPRRPFEEPYWAGQHPAIDPADQEEGEDPYPFPFHPLELGEAALLDFFGYQLEGWGDDTRLQAHEIALMRFKRSKASKAPNAGSAGQPADEAGARKKAWWQIWKS